MGLNALTGIDGFWTDSEPIVETGVSPGLNALTGIDGFWTILAVAMANIACGGS